MKIEITYMSGAGNLFSVIDNREHNFGVDTLKLLAPLLCRKNIFNDFISEGLIAIQNSDKYDFYVNFLNPDGSFGAMCGNGGRCAVAFARELNLIAPNQEKTVFEMAGNLYKGFFDGDIIALKFPPPFKLELNINFEINGSPTKASYVDVGTDHVIIEYKDLKLNEEFWKFDINKYAPLIRYHEKFKPRGVNANFYRINGEIVQLRTYERGVEAETGACGTGAIATAIICNMKHGLNFPVTIIPPSRQELKVNCKFDNSKISEIILSGPAEILDNKQIEIPDNFFEAEND